ncbi:MAG: hypothetical protein JWM87_4150 [Candidatus Eremiobacteraeota bacterium]|nr:hypothetical protein [Candidatus Eremiobacteraeota bacterium]
MSQGRSIAVSLALLLAAGCASGSTTPAPAPAQQRPQSVAQYPAESSAARHILANVGRSGATSRSPQSWDGRDDADDDGGWGELTLPAIQSCGNGTYATDCTIWVWGTNGTGSSGGTRSVVRSAQSVNAGTPPALNFCRDAALLPSDLGAPASPMTGLATSSFSLSYSGTKATPIMSFATRWWNVKLERSFSGTSTFAPAVAVTPLLAGGAARGWLVFFTWSWPSDILLVPYAINEIQVAAASSPLAIPAGGSAPLGAFDCLGRKITARKRGSAFGFNAALTAASLTSAGSELNVPVFGGANPAGSIGLSDDRGARTSVPVVVASASPAPSPTPPGR